MDLWKGEVESGQGEDLGGMTYMMNDGNKKTVSGSPPQKNSLFFYMSG